MNKIFIKGAMAFLCSMAVLGAHASTNYWDNNGDTLGFGAAGGIWGVTGNWSDDGSGASLPAVVDTTTGDDLHFGTAIDGLTTGTITVDGTTQAFKSMTFGAASGAITLTGGTLNMAAPAAQVAVYNPSNTIASVLAGIGGLHKGEVLNYGEFLGTTDKLLFKNARLADCTAIYGTMGGAAVNSKGQMRADAFHLTHTSTNLTFQMQTVEVTNLKCVQVILTQKGDDIYGRAGYARYISSRNPGYNFDTPTYNTSTVGTSWNTGGYGVAQLRLSFDTINPAVLTTTAVTLFPNATLAQVQGVNGFLGGSSVNNGTPRPAQAFFFENNGTTATCQLQTIDVADTKCVIVELSQVGPDIQARALAAKYITRQELGFDFQQGGVNGAYQAQSLSLSYLRDNSLLTLAGMNVYTGDTTIANGTLAISPTGSLGAGVYNSTIKNYGELLYSGGKVPQALAGVITGVGSVVVRSSIPTNTPTLLTWPGFIPATSGLLFPNQNLADFQSVSGFVGGSWVNGGTPWPAIVYDFQNNGAIASFQLQAQHDGSIKCVKVQLTQGGADIYGQLIYAKLIARVGLPYTDFDNSGTDRPSGYEAYNVTLSTQLQPATLMLSGVNNYSGGTVVDCGTIIAEKTRYAISPAGPITINEGGELRLNVVSGMASNNTGGVGEGRAILVNRGGRLTLAASFNAGWQRPIVIDGGTLHSMASATNRSDNYANFLTLKNGAQITGKAHQVGHHSDATLTVAGTNASTIAAGLCLVNSGNKLTLDVADVTGDSAADLVISGALRDYDATLRNMPIVKIGAGCVSLSAVNINQGPYTITQGAICLAGENALNADNDIVLNGGSLELGAFNNSAGTLALAANSELVLDSGSLAFKDSSGLTWSGTLTLSGTLAEGSLRFGTDASGLTVAQLNAIAYDGGKSVRLNAAGYLTATPSGTVISIR